MKNRNGLLLRYMVGPQLFEDKNKLRKEVINEFHKCLLNMNITSTLIIIDPFMYSSYPSEKINDKNKKAEFVISMFKPCLENLSQLVIITNNNIDQKFNLLLAEKIKSINPNIEIISRLTQNFHDRFVYNPILINGISLGASFNGMLKKVNKFDNLSSKDAEDLNSLLEIEKLL